MNKKKQSQEGKEAINVADIHSCTHVLQSVYLITFGFFFKDYYSTIVTVFQLYNNILLIDNFIIIFFELGPLVEEGQLMKCFFLFYEFIFMNRNTFLQSPGNAYDNM